MPQHESVLLLGTPTHQTGTVIPLSGGAIWERDIILDLLKKLLAPLTLAFTDFTLVDLSITQW